MEERNVFLVGLKTRPEKNRTIIQIFIDTDSGITIGECAELSRGLASILDERNLIDTPYELEVSSPGLDQPLALKRQYRRHVGRKFKVSYREGEETKSIEGKLESVSDDAVVLLSEKNDLVTLEFEKIVEGAIRLPW
jgi:ribosome maturation factor RimP